MVSYYVHKRKEERERDKVIIVIFINFFFDGAITERGLWAKRERERENEDKRFCCKIFST